MRKRVGQDLAPGLRGGASEVQRNIIAARGPGLPRGQGYSNVQKHQELRDAEPPATEDDIRAAALQYVRKVSGFRVPARRNEAAFAAAVDEVAASTARLLDLLEAR